MVFETHNLNNNQERLKKAIEIVSMVVKEDSNYTHINEVILNRIIINENSKSFLTKEVDQENKEGYFIVYKRLIHRLRDMILDINNKYRFATSLASTIIEGSLHQHFLKDHFVSITDCKNKVSPTDFFINLTFNSIKS
jgi:hypothetical protein